MKIVSRPELKKIVRRLKSERKKVVFTNGCFDLIQVHHVRILQEAKALGDVLVVAVNTDESVKKLKGLFRPIVLEAERAEMLAALECVDYVTFFGEVTPYVILREVLPDVVAKGGDYGEGQVVGEELMGETGGEVVYLKKWPKRWTTKQLAGFIEMESYQEQESTWGRCFRGGTKMRMYHVYLRITQKIRVKIEAEDSDQAEKLVFEAENKKSLPARPNVGVRTVIMEERMHLSTFMCENP